MFKCKVCEEKDKRILDLKEEISHIRNILNPPVRQTLVRAELEMDNLLSGGNTETVKTSADILSEANELARLQKEQDLILTGNY